MWSNCRVFESPKATHIPLATTSHTGYAACNCNCYRNKCDILVKSIVVVNFPILSTLISISSCCSCCAMMKMNCSLNFDRNAQQTVLLRLFFAFFGSFCCPTAKSCWKVCNKIVASACCTGPKGRRRAGRRRMQHVVGHRQGAVEGNAIIVSLLLALELWAAQFERHSVCSRTAKLRHNNYTTRRQSQKAKSAG